MPKSKKQQEHHTRSKYVDHSRQFVNWINRFEFEKTWFGRLTLRLEDRLKIRSICILFLFCITLSYLLFYDFDFPFQQSIGEIAKSDVKSPVSFEVVDEVATEEKRMKAESSVASVFDFDPSVYDKIANQVFRSFQDARVALDSYGKLDKKELKNLRENFEKGLNTHFDDRVFSWLVTKKFSPLIENLTIAALDTWSEKKIADTLRKVMNPGEQKIVIRTVEQGTALQESSASFDQIDDISRHKKALLAGIPGSEKLSRRDRRVFNSYVANFLVPSINYNFKETSGRRVKARNDVLSVVIAVKKNQIIISKGTLIQPVHVTLLNEIQKLKSRRRTEFTSFISAILLVTLVLVFFSYLRRVASLRIKVETKDLVVMGTVTLIVVFMTKLFWFMTGAAFASKLGGIVPESFFLYAAPVTLGTMLIGLLISSGEVVWLFTVFLATALSLMVEDKYPFFLITTVGGIAAARGVHSCHKRNDIYIAGLRTGLVNALMVTVLFSIQKNTHDMSSGDIGWLAFAGFISGLLASGFAMMLVPLLESIFNYTTDVKLLELSNLNHPLMKEMIVKAPGTYHHSLVVGSMCDAAAEAIGANPLLAKVMAYYHDIGKTEHAAYFIENQRPGHNPHDHLSPHMSKTILIAHVKDGAELGLRYKLGKPLIDGILQHHGTTLISYFYNKALEEQDEDIDLVSEDEFRYPGPKPQFREAALCMLADSIEAAARSLDDPTTARLQNIVRNIIQRKFMEGQLDECNLTLKNLSVIEDAFERILLGIYHQRIDYPKSAGGGASEEAKSSFSKSHKQGSAAG